MRKVIESDKAQVRHVGPLELDDFYRWMKRWFKFKGYWKSEGCEALYDEEIVGPGVKHIRITWNVSKAFPPYIVSKISVVYTLIGVSNIKVPVEGKEVKVYKGDFRLDFSISIERTDDAPSFWRNLYDNVFNKGETDHFVEEAFDDFYDLIEETKQIFNQYV